MKILALCGSLRKESLNGRLLDLAVKKIEAHGFEVDLAPRDAIDLPVFNQDVVDAADGAFPAVVVALKERLAAADGLIIASPEYNYSIPGGLKNAIDWLSRIRPIPFAGKTGLIMGASPSPIGAIRGLWQLRIPLEGCGVLLHPDMFALAAAHKAFNEAGALEDAGLAERFDSAIAAYVDYTRKLKG